MDISDTAHAPLAPRVYNSTVAATIGPAKLDALIATLADVEKLHPDPGGSDR